MLNALRSARTHQSSLFTHSLPNHIPRKPLNSSVRFAQAESGPNKTEEMDSEKPNPPHSTTEDSMSSLGEGYATRSEEEGFGGIYGWRSQYVSKDGGEKIELDDSQGSEVKEKEKGRNQEKVPKEE